MSRNVSARSQFHTEMKQLAVLSFYLSCWIHITVQGQPGCTECAHCKDESRCSSGTCTCPNGCQTFWIGDACDREIPPIPGSYANCSWIKTATSTSLEIGWCQIADLSQEFSSFYGYLLEYTKHGRSERSKGPIVDHLSDRKIQTVVLAGLEAHTAYDITIWPYRTNQGEYDYGTKYDTIVASTLTLEQEKGSSGCSSLPWILFGMACGVISCLFGVIIVLYVKYVRRREPYIKSTKQGVENPVGTQARPSSETSMSSSLPIDGDTYLTTTRSTNCSDHPYQYLVTQRSQNRRENQPVYDQIQS